MIMPGVSGAVVSQTSAAQRWHSTNASRQETELIALCPWWAADHVIVSRYGEKPALRQSLSGS